MLRVWVGNQSTIMFKDTDNYTVDKLKSQNSSDFKIGVFTTGCSVHNFLNFQVYDYWLVLSKCNQGL